MKNIKLHKKLATLFPEYLEAVLPRCSKDTSPKYFFKFQKNVSPKVRHHLKGSWAPVNGYFWYF